MGIASLEDWGVWALVVAEALAMFLTWHDPVLTSRTDRTLTMFVWPLSGVVALWRALDSGMTLSMISWMGALAIFGTCVFTGGQPGVMFLTIKHKGKIVRHRLWRRIIGIVGMLLGLLVAGFWIIWPQI